MNVSQRFERYMEHLAGGLGHMDRHAGLKGYCTGLMLPLSRKSVEPMAARVQPHQVRSAHQSMHHLVADDEDDRGHTVPDADSKPTSRRTVRNHSGRGTTCSVLSNS